MAEKLIDFNPELKVGDNIVLLYMKGETKSPGLKGVVTDINNVFGEDIISVDWEDGSKLSLLSKEDAWTINKMKKLDEQLRKEGKDDFWIQNMDISVFDTKKIVDYLILVRDSGIVNMFGASPYLYLGKERIEHEFKFQDVPDEDKFEEMLDMADEIQSEMINGCIKLLEKNNKELSHENIMSYLRKYSQKLLLHYINVLS